jgi:HlyD family secretion protein
MDMMQERIDRNEEYYRNLDRQKQIIKDQFALQENQFERDSLLAVKGVIASEEFETAKSRYLQGALALENILSTIQTTGIQIMQMREILLDTRQQYQEKKNTLELQLKTYSAQLLSDIQAWEQMYVLMAPVNGEVTFTTYWVENQNITVGDIVFTIVPSENGALLGKASMPMNRSGKVKVGQKVNIRFYNFPDNEFGIVSGLVETISAVPAKTNQEVSNYIVEISLPDGLRTTYQKEMPYLPEMQAQADIITEDYSVLQRFFMPLRKIWTEGLN